jgi:hypothetical protein
MPAEKPGDNSSLSQCRCSTGPKEKLLVFFFHDEFSFGLSHFFGPKCAASRRIILHLLHPFLSPSLSSSTSRFLAKPPPSPWLSTTPSPPPSVTPAPAQSQLQPQLGKLDPPEGRKKFHFPPHSLRSLLILLSLSPSSPLSSFSRSQCSTIKAHSYPREKILSEIYRSDFRRKKAKLKKKSVVNFPNSSEVFVFAYFKFYEKKLLEITC